MDFAQQLVSYYEGEWLEAALLTVFGLVTTGLAVALWQYADHNTLHGGIFYPLAVLAAIAVFGGSLGVYNNNQRLAAMPAQYAQSPMAIVQAELDRFEDANGVNTWWMPLKMLWTALSIVGIALSFSSRSDFVHGLAIGFVVVGAMGFVIDGFAHQRAKLYTAALLGQK